MNSSSIDLAGNYSENLHYLEARQRNHQQERTNSQQFSGEMTRLEELPHVIEMGFRFMRVMVRMGTFNQELSPSFLQYFFQNSQAIAS